MVSRFPRRYPLLNTFVNALSMEETVACVEQIIAEREPTQHVALNPAKVNKMRRDPRLSSIINQSSLITADGYGILLAGKVLKVPITERVTGIDLFQRLTKVAAEKNYRIFLLGASGETVRTVRDNLCTQYPELCIAGYHQGYFNANSDAEVVRAIAESNADMLFVAMGTPRQEYWIYDHLQDLNVPFAMGVGGSFDVIAGHTRRAPLWFQKHGLEWLYRFVLNPRKKWKTGLCATFTFTARLVKIRASIRLGVKARNIKQFNSY